MIEHQQTERNSEQYLFDDEQMALVRDALVELPVEQQVCLLLWSIGFSYEEIAEVTGIPTTSIGSVLARAMETFRSIYNERRATT
jgi:DNA-directed RNA polymerase specialized sigma24 family protein